ncbi:CRISPR-associated proteinr [Lachnospiraceae bacterium TWA4]|nr:CRISPR-associated proteinr [Lachnospiraceae bacterium TWA4]
MNKELEKRTQEWMGLERATLKQRTKAEEYYEKQLMKLIVDSFSENNKESIVGKTDYLILSVGTSYEPLVLSISLLNPKKIMFLYTEKSEASIDKIVKFCGLDASIYDKRKVHETNPLSVYQEIKRAYLMWNRPDKIYIDFTGGTKSMSAAAAMAGAMIDIQLVYVGTEDYLVHFRKPMPGSERLYYISNPYEVFGDLEIEKALSLFGKYNYAGACEKLEILKDKVPDPAIRQQLEFVYQLAVTYEAWDALEFSKAYEAISKLYKDMVRDRKIHTDYILMDFCELIEKQKEILEPMTKILGFIKDKKNMKVLQDQTYIVPLMFTMYNNAWVREEQEKYDSSTLLLYRLLEMISQRRLSLYNLNVSKAEYLSMKYPNKPEYDKKEAVEKLEVFKRKVLEIKKQIFTRCDDYLQPQVALLEGYIYLVALEDTLMGTNTKSRLNYLKKLRSMVFLRNNSIFAHGLAPVSKEDFTRFKNFVILLFQRFCAIEEIDFAQISEDILWINPLESKYCMHVDLLHI